MKKLVINAIAAVAIIAIAALISGCISRGGDQKNVSHSTAEEKRITEEASFYSHEQQQLLLSYQQEKDMLDVLILLGIIPEKRREYHLNIMDKEYNTLDPILFPIKESKLTND